MIFILPMKRHWRFFWCILLLLYLMFYNSYCRYFSCLKFISKHLMFVVILNGTEFISQSWSYLCIQRLLIFVDFISWNFAESFLEFSVPPYIRLCHLQVEIVCLALYQFKFHWFLSQRIWLKLPELYVAYILLMHELSVFSLLMVPHEMMLHFIKNILCFIEIITWLYSVNVMHHIYLFTYLEPSLQIRDKYHLKEHSHSQSQLCAGTPPWQCESGCLW